MNSIPNDKHSRAREIEEAWRAKDWTRVGELFDEYVRRAARKAACDFCLPWKLAGLSESGKVGIWMAYRDQRDTELGLPLERYVESCIDRKIQMDAEAIHKSKMAGKDSLPPEESIGEAYRTFSKDEWDRLIARCNKDDLKVLLSYLNTNKEELTQSSEEDWPKYSRVYAAAAKRSMILRFSQGRWVATPISDPVWATVWRERSRKRTRQGLPRPSQRRSWMEIASDRAVAEALGYDPDNTHKQVASWRKRMQDVPFEKYVEKFGGNWSDYLTWVRNPRLHQKIQSPRPHHEG
jgi:hypothetical protein